MNAKREDIIAATPTRTSRAGGGKSLVDRREIRIFMDGAFDVMHYGHMNAFRLGRSLGTYLIVGVNSDESISECKGPPLMDDKERLTMVEACKFVDLVVPGCPYVMTSEYLDHIFETYDVDYVVHGDDPCVVDGKDVYASAKRRGRYRSIPRTEGVSTTDIVGRMLLMTKEHHLRTTNSGRRNNLHLRSSSFSGGPELLLGAPPPPPNDDVDSDNEIHDDDDYLEGEGRMTTTGDDDVSVMTAVNFGGGSEDGIGNGRGVFLGHQSKFLTTSMMLRLFSADVKPPEDGMRVIYVDGAWDMFHCGHVEFLKAVSKVGVFSDIFFAFLLHSFVPTSRRSKCPYSTLRFCRLTPFAYFRLKNNNNREEITSS
jgi:cytidyltransferase-like protein